MPASTLTWIGVEPTSLPSTLTIAPLTGAVRICRSPIVLVSRSGAVLMAGAVVGAAFDSSARFSNTVAAAIAPANARRPPIHLREALRGASIVRAAATRPGAECFAPGGTELPGGSVAACSSSGCATATTGSACANVSQFANRLSGSFLSAFATALTSEAGVPLRRSESSGGSAVSSFATSML